MCLCNLISLNICSYWPHSCVAHLFVLSCLVATAIYYSPYIAFHLHYLADEKHMFFDYFKHVPDLLHYPNYSQRNVFCLPVLWWRQSKLQQIADEAIVSRYVYTWDYKLKWKWFYKWWLDIVPSIEIKIN